MGRPPNFPWGRPPCPPHKTSRKYNKNAYTFLGTANLMFFIGVTGLTGSLVRGVLAGYQAVHYCTDNLGAFANLLGNPSIISFKKVFLKQEKQKQER